MGVSFGGLPPKREGERRPSAGTMGTPWGKVGDHTMGAQVVIGAYGS